MLILQDASSSMMALPSLLLDLPLLVNSNAVLPDFTLERMHFPGREVAGAVTFWRSTCLAFAGCFLDRLSVHTVILGGH